MKTCANDNIYRWLNTDQDAAGLRVIADFHGGDPENLKAQAEFQEIKDKVLQEVHFPFIVYIYFSHSDFLRSTPREKEGPIGQCGESISKECCWPCRHSLLRNWLVFLSFSQCLSAHFFSSLERNQR